MSNTSVNSNLHLTILDSPAFKIITGTAWSHQTDISSKTMDTEAKAKTNPHAFRPGT